MKYNSINAQAEQEIPNCSIIASSISKSMTRFSSRKFFTFCGNLISFNKLRPMRLRFQFLVGLLTPSVVTFLLGLLSFNILVCANQLHSKQQTLNHEAESARLATAVTYDSGEHSSIGLFKCLKTAF
jgi:hypothetical protein